MTEPRESCIAFPLQHNWQALEELVVHNKSKQLLANPPPSPVSHEEMRPIQITDVRHYTLLSMLPYGMTLSSDLCEVIMSDCEHSFILSKLPSKLCMWDEIFNNLMLDKLRLCIYCSCGVKKFCASSTVVTVLILKPTKITSYHFTVLDSNLPTKAYANKSSLHAAQSN